MMGSRHWLLLGATWGTFVSGDGVHIMEDLGSAGGTLCCARRFRIRRLGVVLHPIIFEDKTLAVVVVGVVGND